MEYAVKTLQQAVTHFADSENCRKFMVFMRWPDGKVKCPHCDCEKVTWLAKAKVYQCYGDHPKSKFSLKVGTVFEDSAIGLEKWLPAVWLLSNSKNGISSYEVHRALGVTQKTAWFMLHRIRLAMVTKSFAKMGGRPGGPVEIDEAYIGGPAEESAPRQTRSRSPARNTCSANGGDREGLNPDYVPHVCGRATKKIPVFGMLDREAREVRAHVIPEVKREVLMEAILSNIEKALEYLQ